MRNGLPFISVIIPTYSRPESLRRCLEAVAQLDYPRDSFEVIVMDDGGNVPLEEKIAPFSQSLDLKMFRQSNAGPATARNLAAGQAKGELLAFTDDDCEVMADWLEKMAKHHAVCPQTAVGGKTLNADPGNIFSTASQFLIDYLYDYYHEGESKELRFFCSNNFAFPADLFRQIGGFDPSFPFAAGEDRELCARWQHHGFSMVYDEEMKVYHKQSLTGLKFLKQQFNYGRGAFHFHRIRKRHFQKSVQMEPLKFYLDLIHFPFLKASFNQALLLSFLFVISQMANAAGFFWESFQQGSNNVMSE